MHVKMILPALTEAVSPFWRPIKYSLFPPLGLATLAGYLPETWEVEIQDEHVERLRLDDTPDLVVIQVYITSARRAYALADHYRRRGAHVCLGGLHVTSLPDEAAQHADTLFLGPGEDTWPQFLADFQAGRPGAVYRSTVRTLEHLPRVRRDLIKRHLYLVPNSIVVSRGCPHHCDFCYKDAFFGGGRSFYTQRVDAALAEIERLPGRHLYFLDDHLFGDPRFAAALFAGMRGMGRVWQAAGTVQSVLRPGLVEQAAAAGLRSLFVGFETLEPGGAGRAAQGAEPGPRLHGGHPPAARQWRDGERQLRLRHGRGRRRRVRPHGGLGGGAGHRDRHLPHPHALSGHGACTHAWLRQGACSHEDWDLYDTRHVVFQPAQLSPAALEAGYWRAYRDFYGWANIARGAWCKPTVGGRLRHVAYAAGWKKLEPLWDWVIRAQRVANLRPALEAVLNGVSARGARNEGPAPVPELVSVTGGGSQAGD